jgi:hypothetical protein
MNIYMTPYSLRDESNMNDLARFVLIRLGLGLGLGSYIYTYIHINAHTYTYTYTFTQLITYTYKYTYTYKITYIHIYIYTYTYIYTYIDPKKLHLYVLCSQAEGMVPLVEPDVMMKGTHTLEQAVYINTQIQSTLYKAMLEAGVYMEVTLYINYVEIPYT